MNDAFKPVQAEESNLNRQGGCQWERIPIWDTAAMNFSDHEFNLIRRLIYDKSGIHLKESKKTLVFNRLRKRLSACGLESYKKYVDLLTRDPKGHAELPHFVDALTTNETFFFRHPEHFKYIVDSVIPQAMERKGAGTADGRIRIWSAACSSGEEPYTVAMCLHRSADRYRGWIFDIAASDISRNALEKARTGAYSAYSVSKMPEEYRRRYFTFDRGAATYLLHDEIKRMVRFHSANLLHPFPQGKFDLVLCRNAMIYFDAESKERVLANLFESLVPGGTLIVGYAESMLNRSNRFKYCMPTVFRKESCVRPEMIRGNG
jgi:chemotaxis protein methyltransferase CheR